MFIVQKLNKSVWFGTHFLKVTIALKRIECKFTINKKHRKILLNIFNCFLIKINRHGFMSSIVYRNKFQNFKKYFSSKYFKSIPKIQFNSVSYIFKIKNLSFSDYST